MRRLTHEHFYEKCITNGNSYLMSENLYKCTQKCYTKHPVVVTLLKHEKLEDDTIEDVEHVHVQYYRVVQYSKNGDSVTGTCNKCKLSWKDNVPMYTLSSILSGNDLEESILFKKQD